MDFAGQILVGLIVWVIAEGVLKAKSATSATSTAPSSTPAVASDGTVHQSDAVVYDLNFQPNSPSSVAATSGIDTVDMPNATPTFVSPDEGAI